MIARRPSLSAARLTSLRQRKAWANPTAIATQWSIIVLAAVVATRWGTWYAHVVAILVVATRQHALAVLMHEAAHRLLFHQRWLNDLCADLLLAFPLLTSTHLYRQHHLRHHRYLNGPADPDLEEAQIRRSPAAWLGYALLHLVGAGVFGMWRSASQLSVLSSKSRKRLPPGQRLKLLAWAALVVATISLFDGWPYVALFWLLPSVTFLPPILKLRAVAEHALCTHGVGPACARSVLPGWWERVLLAPCNVNYHLEHHAHPGVPWYSLPALHRALMQTSEYRSQAVLSPSYLYGARGVIRCVWRSEAPTTSRTGGRKQALPGRRAA